MSHKKFGPDQPFWRLLDTNKQTNKHQNTITDKQTDKPNSNIDNDDLSINLKINEQWNVLSTKYFTTKMYFLMKEILMNED